MGCGCYEIRMAAGGRANLVATENCCVLIDEELLKQLNCNGQRCDRHDVEFQLCLGGSAYRKP